MRAVEIIEKKRDGYALTVEEINWFIENYTHDVIPDYQAAALLMAIFLRGMSHEETVALTMAMANSGITLDLGPITDYAVDKHSSGGVGDKTSLVVLPMVASCGVTVAKMSGRGLGFTGGTLDKMESLAGYNVNLTQEDFARIARENGLVLSGQSGDLAPADGKLYALRDATATVPNLPLIVASIMSKKIAAGANGIVLDVKTGSGAFMKTLTSARELARMMVEIGDSVGRDMIAVVSDMNQPLGQAVGNALEVVEAIETLRGGGPADLREHCLVIAGHMLRLAGRGTRWTNQAEVRGMLEERVGSGAALAKFRAMVEAQGGDVSMVDDISTLPRARLSQTYAALQDGHLARVDAQSVAQMALELGAGREKKGDPVDLAVGVTVHHRVGDVVKTGDPLFTLYANDEARLSRALALAGDAIVYSDIDLDPLPLFYDVIYGQKARGG